jgi:hypothetical protein
MITDGDKLGTISLENKDNTEYKPQICYSFASTVR